MKLLELHDVLDVKTLSPSQLAQLHRVPLEKIEIALDHLKEFPDYYDRLEKAER